MMRAGSVLVLGVQGPADVSFAVEPNRSTEPRRIELMVADQRVVISQEAASCAWKLTPGTLSAGAAGEEAHATLAAEDFCSWTAAPKAEWIEIASAGSGKGTAEISLRIDSNGGAERTGTVEFSPGVTLVVQQHAPPVPPAKAPCAFDVAPSKFDKVVPDASSLFVDVKTTAGCAWTASSATTWIIVSPAAGIGTGRVSLSVLSNTNASRTAPVVIAGQTVTVNQNAVVPCAYTISPTSLHLSHSAQTASINVTTNKTSCSVNAVSNQSWIRIGAFPATGSGKIALTVDTNGSTSKRSATITVNGTNFSQAVKVDQDGR
jgi:hypothetical protein